MKKIVFTILIQGTAILLLQTAYFVCFYFTTSNGLKAIAIGMYDVELFPVILTLASVYNIMGGVEYICLAVFTYVFCYCRRFLKNFTIELYSQYIYYIYTSSVLLSPIPALAINWYIKNPYEPSLLMFLALPQQTLCTGFLICVMCYYIQAFL